MSDRWVTRYCTAACRNSVMPGAVVLSLIMTVAVRAGARRREASS